ncbi:MAG: carboxylesterase/lipase family protein [Pseudomonadales bacterium]|nr:carboxylesterase/lipase family protein [Pseudomonadales bacterium]
MTVVETTSGPIEGRDKEGTLLFAGVPYAAPPVGELRFRAAQPPTPWREVRAAKRFGAAAPQIPAGGLTSSAAVRWDEDCLTLNITTPALDDARRPVLFWIHGGAYRTGQGAIPWYNGARFARNGDIVVVSINYRLGALGFTDLSGFGAGFETSGVNGLLDQIVALEWVRDNIARFGGDPAKVCIAGESAGGFAVSTLLASPRAKNLFRAAIPQSGAASQTLPKAAGELCAEKLMAALGARDTDALMKADVQSILEATDRVIAEIGDGPRLIDAFGVPVSAFYPVRGNAVVPGDPLEALRAGAGRDIPLLTGTNRDETTLWGYGEVTGERLKRVAEGYGAGKTLATYQRTRPGGSPEDLMIALTTDQLFRIPAIRMLEARIEADTKSAAEQPSRNWMYLFSWASRAFEGRLGATHALEIPFVFDNLDRAGVDVFIGPGEKPQKVADAMHRAWTGFIRDLDPGWARYDTTNRITMCFDDTSTPIADPDGEERQAWEGI